MFADTNTPIGDAVRRLEEIGAEVTQMKERGKQLNIYQKFLDLEETTFEAVNDSYNDWVLKQKLWKGLDEWIFLSRDWIRTMFNQIDVETIQK